MVRLTGAALGFLAFGIAIVLGLVSGNTFETVLTRAIEAMFIFFALGLAVGWIACRVIDEHSLAEHREMFPNGELAVQPDARNDDTQVPRPVG